MTTEHNEQHPDHSEQSLEMVQPAAAQEAVYRAPWTGTPGRIDENGVEWRPVVGFEQFYEVSSEGRIFSLRHNRLLSNNSVASHGYIKAFFHGDGKRCQTFAHRAVAEAFLGPAEGREVNHLNGIRTDNRVENLDWVTRSENEIHSRYILGNLCEAVIAVSLRTGARVIFRSQAEAEAELCLPRDAVRRCLVGDFKSSMGWTFEKPADSLVPVTAAPVDLDALAVNRYRPVPDGLLAYKVVAGDGTRSLFSGTMNECNVVARKLTEAFLDGAHVASTPAAPASHDVPFATVQRVVRALTQCGVSTPYSHEEQAARSLELIHWLCDEVPKLFASTPAAPGIDVEQFRDCVTTTRTIALQAMANALHRGGERAAADAKRDIDECDHLLALIDARPKGGRTDMQDTALNTLAVLFHNGEEVEGPDGMAVMVDLNLWHEASDAFDVLNGNFDPETLATSAEVGA